MGFPHKMRDIENYLKGSAGKNPVSLEEIFQLEQ